MRKFKTLENDWNVDSGLIVDFVKEDEILEDVYHVKEDIEFMGDFHVFEYALPKNFLEEIE